MNTPKKQQTAQPTLVSRVGAALRRAAERLGNSYITHMSAGMGDSPSSPSYASPNEATRLISVAQFEAGENTTPHSIPVLPASAFIGTVGQDLDHLVGAATRIAYLSDGPGKLHNEDRIYINPSMGVYTVADGLGGTGHNGGQYASAEAVRAAEHIAAQMENYSPNFFETDKGIATLQQLIEHEVRAANKRIHELGNDEGYPERNGMNSTLSLAVIAGSRLFTMNVGDSRIYQVTFSDANHIVEPTNGSRGRLGLIPRQLSTDDSLIEEIKQMKEYDYANLLLSLERSNAYYKGVSANEVRRIHNGFSTYLEQVMHPLNNRVSRALGMAEKDFTVSCAVQPLAGDIMLLSDGAAFLSPADLTAALGTVQWDYKRGERRVELDYTVSPQNVADLIADSASTSFSENSPGVGFGAWTTFRKLKIRELIIGNNMLNSSAIERHVKKPLSAIGYEEVVSWAQHHNPASIPSDKNTKEFEQDWLAEFNEQFVGKDDVSVVYVRARPATPADIRHKLSWRGNQRLHGMYGGELTNRFSRTEYARRAAEDDAAYMRALFVRLGVDPTLYQTLDALLGEAKAETGRQAGAAASRIAGKLGEIADLKAAQTVHQEEIRKLNRTNYTLADRLTAVTGVLSSLVSMADPNEVYTTIKRKFAGNSEEDQEMCRYLTGIVQAYQQEREATQWFNGFLSDVHVPMAAALRTYRSRFAAAETERDAARGETETLRGQLGEQTSQIKQLTATSGAQQRELGTFLNQVVTSLTGEITPEAVQDKAALYRFAGLNPYAAVMDAVAGFLGAYAQRREEVGMLEAEAEKTVVQPLAALLSGVPEQYHTPYQTGLRAFAEGNLSEARTALETFRGTDVAPGLYLLGTVVERLYPDNSGAQKFSRHLIGKARTLDTEIETHMHEVLAHE
ncbi:MAG: protein phosphatase 2C domain-containing protein [Candidatus Woesearchaeota archaeon]|nr:protein phosphatase 2C domain-containing protein [Candidatus Woesearchaeota archaeon]